LRRSARFALVPGGAVELTAKEGMLRHFRDEYGAPDATQPVRLAISIDDRLPDGAVIDLRGRHKTVSWSVSLGPADGRPLRAMVALHGRPRWFGVSLVQGFIVEPLISLACAIGGQVLLPAAAIAEKGGALLIMGRSRSGKSSVSARALALGRQVLGDDQVLVDPAGVIVPFPRRIRVYDDLLDTSPMAVDALPLRARLSLRLRRLVRIGTRGFVAPSLALPRSAFGAGLAAEPMPVHRIVVVRRSAGAQGLSTERLEYQDVLSEAVAILGEQRRRLSRLDRDDWLTLLASVEQGEARILGSALRGAPAHLVTVPEAWGAPSAIEAVAGALDIT